MIALKWRGPNPFPIKQCEKRAWIAQTQQHFSAGNPSGRFQVPNAQDFQAQPATGISPVVRGGRGRDSQRVRGLFNGQADEKTELDEVGPALVGGFELVERVVQREQIDVRLGNRRLDVVSGINGPGFLTFDSAGNLYVAGDIEIGNNTVAPEVLKVTQTVTVPFSLGGIRGLGRGLQ